MTVPLIRPLTDADADWFREVWMSAKHILGTGHAVAWHRWKASTSQRHHIDGIERVGFVHYLRRTDLGSTIYDIAVAPEHRGRGVGRALVDHVGGLSVRLTTDRDDPDSNAFYRALGFRRTDVQMAKSGKLKNVWERVR